MFFDNSCINTAGISRGAYLKFDRAANKNSDRLAPAMNSYDFWMLLRKTIIHSATGLITGPTNIVELISANYRTS